MSLDLIASITLTAVAIICIIVIFLTSGGSSKNRRRLALLTSIWFTVIAALTATGIFTKLAEKSALLKVSHATLLGVGKNCR